MGDLSTQGLDSLELRQRLRQVSERIAQLAAEQQGLRQACDQLRVEARQVERTVASARDSRAALEERLEAQRRRALAIEAQISSTQQEITELDDRCQAEAGRSRDLARRREGAEAAVTALKGELTAADSTLGLVRDSLSRLNDRLALRAPRPAPGTGRRGRT